MDRTALRDVGFWQDGDCGAPAFKAVMDGKQVAVLCRPRCSPSSTT